MCTYRLFLQDLKTMAVGPAVSVSVIGLIIDPSIPAGAGHAARNNAFGEGGRTRRVRLKWWSVVAALVSRRTTHAMSTVSSARTHTRTHTQPAELNYFLGRLLTYIYCSSFRVDKLCLF